MIWCESHRKDVLARVLADRHYSRQSIGAADFVPPGRCAVFYAEEWPGRAYWVTSWPFTRYVKHAWAGAWICSAFRTEGLGPASAMIREAVAATRFQFGDPPALGMVTFIDARKVKPMMRRGRKVWGYTYMKAGFTACGSTKGGLLAFQLLPSDMPDAQPPKEGYFRMMK